MPTALTIADANAAIIAKAARYISAIASQATEISGAPAPRFEIHFVGFGTGGTAGVDEFAALRYLRAMGSSSDPHTRYRRAIQEITVRVIVPTVTFTA